MRTTMQNPPRPRFAALALVAAGFVAVLPGAGVRAEEDAHPLSIAGDRLSDEELESISLPSPEATREIGHFMRLRDDESFEIRPISERDVHRHLSLPGGELPAATPKDPPPAFFGITHIDQYNSATRSVRP